MRRSGAAIIAGAIAGLVMSGGMMVFTFLRGRSIWTVPDLIAAMWLGDRVAIGELSFATAIGFLTHMATSALMGWIAIPFIRDLSCPRTILASVSYSVASYPVVFAGVLSWANPLMVVRSELIPMTIAHAIFGVVMGAVYQWLSVRG